MNVSIIVELVSSLLLERYSKLLQKVVLLVYEVNMREAWAGFRNGYSEQILSLQQIFERNIRSGQGFDGAFVHFAGAFDSVHQDYLWAAILIIILLLFSLYFTLTFSNYSKKGSFCNKSNVLQSKLVLNKVASFHLAYKKSSWNGYF